MKRIILCLIVSAISISIVFAQESEPVKKSKMEISAGYTYAEFNDDFMKKIYPSMSGFELSILSDTKFKWLSVGLFYKHLKAEDGNPHLYGDISMVEGATSEIKFSSWGPEVCLNASENFRFFTRIGFLKIKETFSSNIVSGDESVKATTIDLGTKIYIPIGNAFKLFGKVDYSIVSLNEGEANGDLNYWSIGGGVALRF